MASRRELIPRKAKSVAQQRIDEMLSNERKQGHVRSTLDNASLSSKLSSTRSQIDQVEFEKELARKRAEETIQS